MHDTRLAQLSLEFAGIGPISFKVHPYDFGGYMGKKLYVGNLAFAATEQTITDKFSSFGTVESAKIITDRDTGRSKGFAFVEMSTEDEAQQAIEALNGQPFEGRNLTVNEAKPMEPRTGGFNRGGGNRGGFGGGRR